jgi:drug/metabolite transporter (DMT)-like permease
MWLLFALLSGALFTGESLMTRHVLRAGKDAWAFSFYFSLIGSIISFPFMLADPKIPHSLTPWLLAILVGILIVCNNLLMFKTFNYLEASLSGALLKFKLVWIFILSVIFLSTPFSWEKLIGTLLATGAGIVIIHNIRRPKSITGVAYVISATIFNAAVIILFKYLLTYFSPASLTFYPTFLLPLLINFTLMPNARTRIKKIYSEDGKMLTFACALGAFANLALNKSLSLGDVTSVLVIIEAFLVFTLVGEHFFLKEKEHLWIKVTAVSLATAGAILIRLSG